MKRFQLLSLLVFVTVILAGPALAYEDRLYNFSVQGPKDWVSVSKASVPGVFRFGWTSPEWAQPGARNVWGASISAFIKDTEGNSARELLQKNVDVIQGKTAVKPDPRTALRVLKQQAITVDGNAGFILEVIGNGTGFSIGIPPQVDAKGNSLFKIVPTRQRWYCVVKGKTLIGLLSTCPESKYAEYAPTFAQVERSLKLR